MNARLMFVHALTPLHAGTGQGVGVIDLPIAREQATGLPYLPGSSLKGTLRDACPEAERAKVFGPESGAADEYASSVQCSDQRLLLLPVRSLKCAFAWVTSPYVLRRLQRDAMASGVKGLPAEQIPNPTVSDSVVQCAAAQPDDLKIAVSNNQQAVVLEDLDLTPQATLTNAAKAWAGWIADQVFPPEPANTPNPWRAELLKRFCVVPDEVLLFLLNTGTEVTARIRLDDKTKTVATGQLWYEEALPAETILYGLVSASETRIKQTGNTRSTVANTFAVIAGLTGQAMQFGGKATTGRGLCQLRFRA